MSRVNINVSGANSSGSSFMIYATPEYNYSWQGACVMHGSFAAGPTSPDNQRIEVVELCLPGLNIRVRADNVRNELRALLTANKAWKDTSSSELESARYTAFINLQTAVFGITAREITFTHLERIAHTAYADGLRDGKESLREQFRALLGL